MQSNQHFNTPSGPPEPEPCLSQHGDRKVEAQLAAIMMLGLLEVTILGDLPTTDLFLYGEGNTVCSTPEAVHIHSYEIRKKLERLDLYEATYNPHCLDEAVTLLSRVDPFLFGCRRLLDRDATGTPIPTACLAGCHVLNGFFGADQAIIRNLADHTAPQWIQPLFWSGFNEQTLEAAPVAGLVGNAAFFSSQYPDAAQWPENIRSVDELFLLPDAACGAVLEALARISPSAGNSGAAHQLLTEAFRLQQGSDARAELAFYLTSIGNAPETLDLIAHTAQTNIARYHKSIAALGDRSVQGTLGEAISYYLTSPMEELQRLGIKGERELSIMHSHLRRTTKNTASISSSSRSGKVLEFIDACSYQDRADAFHLLRRNFGPFPTIEHLVRDPDTGAVFGAARSANHSNRDELSVIQLVLNPLIDRSLAEDCAQALLHGLSIRATEGGLQRARWTPRWREIIRDMNIVSLGDIPFHALGECVGS